MKFKLLVKNAAQIVQVCRNGETMKKGKSQMNDVCVLENASMVVDNDGRIHVIDTAENVTKLDWFEQATFENTLDASGLSITPGLVDGHTHPLWSGDRVHEYELKLAGATYMDVHKAGGGIGFTVSKTRESSEDDLYKGLIERMDRMLRLGTTYIEAKSGYGLELDTEMKMLRVLHRASKSHSVGVSATYLGAHSVPKTSNATDYAREVVHKQLPELIRLKQLDQISPENIDVFHEKGVFETEETKAILEAGKQAGLVINFHGDELHPMDSAVLGSSVGAHAISHLEEVSDDGISAMSGANIHAVLLPTTAYVLRLKPPPARKLIDNGVPVALGSDFNPNAFCMSMPHVMNLACHLMHMTLSESLVAATINSASSINKSKDHGSLEVGKFANFVIVNNRDWRHLIYEMADAPIHSVWIKGENRHSR